MHLSYAIRVAQFVSSVHCTGESKLTRNARVLEIVLNIRQIHRIQVRVRFLRHLIFITKFGPFSRAQRRRPVS